MRIFFRDLKLGIQNLWDWFPIVWADRDWDWEFISLILQLKLSRMAKRFQEGGHHLDSEKQALDMRICVEALKRISEVDRGNRRKVHADLKWSNGAVFEYRTKRLEGLQKIAFGVMGKRLRSWWD